ncbi:MAG TPA: alpha-L-rhamnosidase C-terminal domain-containing protein [Mycobacteriales bacterium]|nr:alpha-L-rhamnosidase C-terminal domain-containing protein [Mycobacteriales bacterium]
MTHAAASMLTPYGPLASSWRRADDKLTLEVEIPVGADAELRLPEPWRAAPPPGATGTETSHRLGSGHWTITATR